MAIVYLAGDLKHDRKVAIKVMRPEVAASLGPERFLREIRIAAKLNHPHILSLYDSGEADGFLYFVMPFVEGQSLRDKLSREKQLPVEEAVRLVQEVAAALSYAHDNGIVHRDVKPENILLSHDAAILADLGIARAVSESAGDAITETGLAVGTPAYMSPEQSSAQIVDGRSDTYSLGCVLYELLTGQPPFVGTSAQSVMARHAMDPVPSVRTVRPSVPEHVVQSIITAMEKVPADRFTHASGFAQALSPSPPRGVDGSPLPGESTRAPAPVRFWRVPSKRSMLAVTVVFALVAGFVGWRWYARAARGTSVRAGRTHQEEAQLLTVTWERTPLRVALDRVAEAGSRNIDLSPAADTVQVTARFEDEPWGFVLANILDVHDLRIAEVIPGALYVLSHSEMLAREEVEPVRTAIIPLERTRASSVLGTGTAHSYLSDYGVIYADTLVNHLFVTDLASRVFYDSLMIAYLDRVLD